MALLVLALVAAKCGYSLDPQKMFSQYVRTLWTTDAGMPQTSVYAIAQTRDGYLWIGTEAGVARFDGVRFSIFNQRNVPNLPANYVHRLLAGRDGSLWIGTDSGLARYSGEAWTSWTAKSGLSNDDIQAMVEGPDGSLWVGTDGGLNRLHDGRVDTWHVKDGLPDDHILALQVDPAGVLWIGTRTGLASFDGHQFRSFQAPGGSSSQALSALATAGDGSVWCASTDGKLYRESGGTLSAISVNLPHTDVQAMLFDRDGSLWLGFENHGFARLHNGELTLVDSQDVLHAQTVEALLEDAEHNIWLGTFDSGLVQLHDGKFTVYGMAEGIPSAVVCCSVEAADGTVWVGTAAGEVIAIHPDRTMRIYTTRNGLPSEGIHSMLLGRDGTIWIGHRHGVLTQYRNGQFRHFQSAVAKNHAINGLLEDGVGRIWIGTYGAGLMRFEDGRFEQVLTDLDVPALAQTSDGAIWVGSDGQGLIKLKDGVTTRYTNSDGLINDHVLSLWVDGEDTLWVGFISGGLGRIRNGKITSFTAAQGLFDPTVANLMDDDLGNLWMGSDSGISRVSKKELEQFAEGHISEFHSVGYNTADGLRSRETMQGGTGCGMKGKDGRLWFPTLNGLARIDPRRALEADPPLHVRIESLQLDAGNVSLGSDIRFRHGSSRLSFQFTALTFIDSARVRFRYRLEGYDKEWIDAGNSRVASYTNLPPGKYWFQVQAARYNGDWEPEPTSTGFTVDPRWFETPLAWTLWGFSACLITWGIVRLRTSTLVRRRHELEVLVAERTHQLNEEKTALAAAREELQEQATHDSLTGVWNRGAIFNLLKLEIERARRERKTLSVVMADLDHFKVVNDTYGHLWGDLVLIEVARCLHSSLRVYDSIGRYGGEEFLILMPGCDPVKNLNRLHELLESVGSRKFSNSQVQFQITCSFGVSVYRPGQAVPSAEDLLNGADQALYSAKHLGRNRVEFVESADVSRLRPDG
ncbi:MAG: two-component regulator propeller domain-containing protein [Terracidiphilus sp.]